MNEMNDKDRVIFINRKHIFLVLILVVIAVFYYLLITANNEIAVKENKTAALQKSRGLPDIVKRERRKLSPQKKIYDVFKSDANKQRTTTEEEGLKGELKPEDILI
ncbi:MAG: hypothetical protein PHY46_02005 [Candidatus Omnitrophica bacterium]|nr:hypothetical protein [Candidatus Omnitrophota bacterium]